MTSTEHHLSYLEPILKELGYKTNLTLKSDLTPFDILSVKIILEKSGVESDLDLLYYPRTMDLEQTDFLQFYFQFPYILSFEEIKIVSQLLPHINNRISLGHTSINFNENKIQYKYVLALPVSSKPDPFHFKDIFEVFYYTPSLFEKSIVSLLKDKKPLEEVVKHIL